MIGGSAGAGSAMPRKRSAGLARIVASSKCSQASILRLSLNAGFSSLLDIRFSIARGFGARAAPCLLGKKLFAIRRAGQLSAARLDQPAFAYSLDVTQCDLGTGCPRAPDLKPEGFFRPRVPRIYLDNPHCLLGPQLLICDPEHDRPPRVHTRDAIDQMLDVLRVDILPADNHQVFPSSGDV